MQVSATQHRYTSRFSESNSRAKACGGCHVLRKQEEKYNGETKNGEMLFYRGIGSEDEDEVEDLLAK